MTTRPKYAERIYTIYLNLGFESSLNWFANKKVSKCVKHFSENKHRD